MKFREYVADTELLARPMAPQAMEFISDMGFFIPAVCI